MRWWQKCERILILGLSLCSADHSQLNWIRYHSHSFHVLCPAFLTRTRVHIHAHIHTCRVYGQQLPAQDLDVARLALVEAEIAEYNRRDAEASGGRTSASARAKGQGKSKKKKATMVRAQRRLGAAAHTGL